MEIGIVIPQGFISEYAGWSSTAAWSRMVSVAQESERLGFESVWLCDHFHTTPTPTDEPTFEAFTSLTALAVYTRRVRIGHLVLSAGYRNPAVVAKMASTLDVISNGRMEIGLGAGWQEDEWLAYGIRFGPVRERLAALADALEVVTRMLAPGRASYAGAHSSVNGAVNVPKGLQVPRLPVLVGGNGPEVTWRLAARHADELNLDGLSVEETERALPTIRARCEEIGRDPATLRVSLMSPPLASQGGKPRIESLQRLSRLSLARVMVPLTAATHSNEALDSLRVDAMAAGIPLAT